MPPCVGKSASHEDVDELMCVEQLVSYSTVERFDMRAVRRLSRIDEVQADRLFGGSLQHRAARNFGAIVEAKRGRLATEIA